MVKERPVAPDRGANPRAAGSRVYHKKRLAELGTDQKRLFQDTVRLLRTSKNNASQ